MWVDDNLRWDLHVERRCLAVLRRQRSFLRWLTTGAGTAQRSVATRLYTGVIRPQVEYGSELYGVTATSPNLLRRLETLQTELLASIVGITAGSAAHAAIRAEVGVESLRVRRRWARLRLLSKVAGLGSDHRLHRLWRARLADGWRRSRPSSWRRSSG